MIKNFSKHLIINLSAFMLQISIKTQARNTFLLDAVKQIKIQFGHFSYFKYPIYVNSFMTNQIYKILKIIFFLLILLILIASLRGNKGNPNSGELSTTEWTVNGPFELSPERGRFALTYSLIEDKSFYFSNNIGKFADPDVAISKGHYVSLFAPLVSFLVMPGYLIGKFFGISQVGAFGIISIFSFLNMILLRLIAIRLGAKPLAANIASMIFLFGSPAFGYAVNLYQHHISTFLILLSIWGLLKTEKYWSLFLAFFLCAAAIPLDYPNLFFMFPIGLYALGRMFSFEKIRSKISIGTSPVRMLTPIIMVLPIIFFLWFNQQSFGNPFQLSGTLQTTKGAQNTQDLASIEAAKILKAGKNKKSPISFFETRNLLNGFYIHFMSPDRGVIYYAPVVLFGLAGIVLSLKKRVRMVSVLVGVLGANILLYSMWGDPWGGWAFGSRYLIPSYAILSIFIGLLLTYWGKRILFILPFLGVAFYSIAVNTLGAITTSAMPPKVEVLNLEKLSGVVQKYTYARNWDMLQLGHSKSFVYQTYLVNYISAVTFYEILVILICGVVGVLTIFYCIALRRGKINA